MKRRVKKPAQVSIKRSDQAGSPAYFGFATNLTRAAVSSETTAKALPPYLMSTCNMLMSAFPDGVPEENIEAIAVILGKRLSYRNIAKVLEASGYVDDGNGYHLAMSVLADAHLGKNGQRTKAMNTLLRKHGLDDWLKEHELPGDEEV